MQVERSCLSKAATESPSRMPHSPSESASNTDSTGGATRLLHLSVSCQRIGARHGHRGVDIVEFAAGGLERGFRPWGVEPEAVLGHSV